MSGLAAAKQPAPLNVLIVEDSEEDAHLMVLELKRCGYDPHCLRVEDEAGMARALEERDWDLVLSDFSLPRFSLRGALELLQRKEADTPFVIVSATIGEEAAVEAMKAGAHDYVLKHRMGRLGPAVERELRECAVRRERRRLEEQLRHAQKLESLGLLAGGVAHDFNNLLTGILGNASLALDCVDGNPDVRLMLQDIIHASERAADLTRQLLAYAGKGRLIVEPLDFSEIVRDISELIRTSVPHSVELALDLHPSLPMVAADAAQIQQLVMNLILNALEATGERPGVVRVTTGLCDIRPGDMLDHFRPEPPPPGRYVFVEVSDNGCGMNEEVRAHLFDPFFTTKFTGRGLGLAAALGIVRGHHGAIGVQSKEGLGSCFTVLAPAVDLARCRNALEPEQPESTITGMVLIIDDEEVVRRAARSAMEHNGFTVFEAADGREGVELFDRLHDRLSGVLLDLTMPRMDGREVWSHIRGIRPDMKILVSSGFEEPDAMKRFAEEPGLAFIKKPYRASALVQRMRLLIKQP